MMRRILLLAMLLSAMGPFRAQAAQLASEDCAGGAGNLGANWTLVTSFDMPQLSGAGVCQNKTGGVAAIATYTGVGAWPNDQYFQAKIVSAISNNTRIAGVVLRSTGTARTQYECVVAGPLGATATLTIYRFNAGAPTTLAGGTAIYTVNANDTLYCEVKTSTVILKINGSQILTSGVDGSPLASGTPGIVVYSGGAVTDTTVDDIVGGNFVTASAGTTSLGYLEVDE